MRDRHQRPLIPVDPQGLDDIAAKLLITPLNTSAGVSDSLPDKVLEYPHNYIFVPEKNKVIATRQGYDDLNWDGELRALQADGLRMTQVDSFMQHFLNLRDAALGNKQLVYADNTPLSRQDAILHWNYVSSKDRTSFGNKPFWTWLDALFKENAGVLVLETDHHYKGSKLESRTIKIDPHTGTNGWADLSLNSQGLPKNTSGSDYIQGQNILFWIPVKDRVARFSADSDGARLGCDGDRTSRGGGLGVLACAAGVAKNF